MWTIKTARQSNVTVKYGVYVREEISTTLESFLFLYITREKYDLSAQNVMVAAYLLEEVQGRETIDLAKRRRTVRGTTGYSVNKRSKKKRR